MKLDDKSSQNWEDVNLLRDEVLPQGRFSRLYVFDFDECLVDLHVSKHMTELRDRELGLCPSVDATMLDYSTEGLYSIVAAWQGLTRSKINHYALVACEATRWRAGAHQVIESIIRDPMTFAVIASSGLSLAIEKWLDIHRLDLPVVATRLKFDRKDICTGPSLLVTDRVKTWLVTTAISSGNFGSVVAVGQSDGDAGMLEAANVSIALKGTHKLEEVADYVIRSFEELKDISY